MPRTAPSAAAGALDAYRDAVAGARLLGHILWFTVRRARVAPADLADWFDELGLDPRLLPAPINPVHAFKVATSEARLEYPMPRAGQTALAQIREVTSDRDQVIRHVMREVRDARRVRLSYLPVDEAVFRRQTPGGAGPTAGFTAHIDPHDANPQKAAEGARLRDWLDAVHARYHDLCVHLHSPRLRAVLRDAITSLEAVAVRPSGGVYFAHLRHSAVLHLALNQRWQTLSARATDYAQLLRTEQARAAAALDLAADAIADLAGRIDPPCREAP